MLPEKGKSRITQILGRRRATAASLSTRCPKSSEYRFGKVDWINLKISFLTKDAIIMIQLMTFSWLIT